MNWILAIAFVLTTHPTNSIAEEAVPTGREEAASLAISHYSECSKATLYLLGIDSDECRKRIELARRECFSVIQARLPERLSERDLYILGHRSLACYMSYRDGKTYSNEEVDPLIGEARESLKRPQEG